MSPAPPLPTSESEADSLLASLRDHLATLSPSDSPLGLVSVLKQAQRLASSTIVHAKAQTAEVRLTLDKKTLDKMGLEYEKRRLTSEIQRCEDFESVHCPRSGFVTELSTRCHDSCSLRGGRWAGDPSGRAQAHLAFIRPPRSCTLSAIATNLSAQSTRRSLSNRRWHQARQVTSRCWLH